MNETYFQLDHVCKSFHTVKAVNDVSFSIGKGEVHAICGENGAGKSTMMNLIAGVYRIDSGEMRLDGQVYDPKNPADARRAGVSIVFQELSMFSLQTTEMNIFAGKELTKGLSLDHKEMRRRTQQVLDEMELDIDLDTPVELLTIGQRQWIEIARAIADDAKILILDEPNSALNMYETEILFRLIREQTAKGMTILYISHRMDEVFEISDRITVMRDGRYIKTLNTADTNVDEIISLMLGHDTRCVYTRSSGERGDVVLDVQHLTVGDAVQDVSFQVRAGSVVGLSGLAGCGYETILKVLFGLQGFDGGTITLDGEVISPASPLDAMKKNIAMVPSDRRDTGLMTEWSIAHNIAQSVLRMTSRKGLIRHKDNRRIAEEYIQQLNVVCTSPENTVIELSGGNQQKVLLAKWLATNPKLLILDDPTRGIDVGAKQEIYQLIDRITRQGFAVVLTSSEIDELTALSDEILLFRNGKHIKTVPAGTTKGTILKYIAGESVERTAAQEQSAPAEAAQEARLSLLHRLKKLLSFKESGVLLALIAVIVGFAVFVPAFMTGGNMSVSLKQMSILGILTFAMTFVFCANEVDLSVGMVLNATMGIMALLMTTTGLNPWLCVLIGLVFATALGALNGLLAVAFDLPTIVITLGTMSIYRGLALVINGGKTISGLPAGSFLNMARVQVGGVSLLSVICLVIFVLCAWMFRNSKSARHLLLSGDNQIAAKKRGINTNRLRVGVMAMSGLMCGIGAALTLSNLTSADTTTGSDYAMSVIGAVVIGGTKMGGGAGSMWGSLIGIALVTVIQNGLVFLGLQSGWRSLFIGVTMLIAIAIDTVVEKRALRRHGKQ